MRKIILCVFLTITYFSCSSDHENLIQFYHQNKTSLTEITNDNFSEYKILQIGFNLEEGNLYFSSVEDKGQAGPPYILSNSFTIKIDSLNAPSAQTEFLKNRKLISRLYSLGLSTFYYEKDGNYFLFKKNDKSENYLLLFNHSTGERKISFDGYEGLFTDLVTRGRQPDKSAPYVYKIEGDWYFMELEEDNTL